LAFIISAESLINAFAIVFGVLASSIIFSLIGTVIVSWLIYDYSGILMSKVKGAI